MRSSLQSTKVSASNSPRSRAGPRLSLKRHAEPREGVEEDEAKAIKLTEDQPDRPSGLMRLPLEIRNVIYQYSVIPRKHLILRDVFDTKAASMLEKQGLAERPKLVEEQSRHSLKLSSRQLYQEVSDFTFREAPLAINLERWLPELLRMGESVKIRDWDFRQTYLDWLTRFRKLSFRVKQCHLDQVPTLILLLQTSPLRGIPSQWNIYITLEEDVPARPAEKISLIYGLGQLLSFEGLKINICFTHEDPTLNYSGATTRRRIQWYQVHTELHKEITSFCHHYDIGFCYTPALDPTLWLQPIVSRLTPSYTR